MDTHEAEEADRRGQSGLKADARRTHGGHMADTRRAHGGRTDGRQGLEAGPKQTQGIQGGSMEKARSRRGRGQSIPRPAFFFPEREPHSKLFGGKK